jgi:hypothetical protein
MNPTKFCCRKEIKTKQGYDKKKPLKLILNKLKVMGNSTFIYTYWATSLKKFLKKLSIYMCTHVHIAFMCEL